MSSIFPQQGPPPGYPSSIDLPAQGDPAGAGDQADAPLHEKILQALEPIKALLEADGTLDPAELVTIEDFRTKLMKILATRQKEADGMLQGKMTPSAVRRAA